MNSHRRRPNRTVRNLARRRSQRKARLSSRSLFAERLEDRRLLTGVGGSDELPFHNHFMSTDVSGDYRTSPRDALLIINALNESGSRPLDPNDPEDANLAKVDVSSDNQLSPVDALIVINKLNRGEGLDPGDIVQFTLELQDADGVPIEPLTDSNGDLILDNDGNPIRKVKVGDDFRVQIYVEDLRPDNEVPEADGGVFKGILDVAYDNVLFTLGGTFPDDFHPNRVNEFRDFFATGPQYSNLGTKTAYPSAADIDGDQVADELDEVGTIAPTLVPTGKSVKPFMHGQFTAATTGRIEFAGNQSDQSLPDRNVLLFGVDDPVSPDVIDFGLPVYLTIVQPVNAQDDSAAVDEDGSVSVDVLDNDFLDDNSTGPIVIDSFTQGVNGSVARVSGELVYTPTADFNGTDTFTYTAANQQNETDTATVTVTINAVNDPPVAVDDDAALDEDSGTVTVAVLDNDNGGPADEVQTLTISATTPPAHGAITVVDNNTKIEYTPDQDFFGTDTFTYTIVDDGVLTDTATVTITVNAVNDAPVADDDSKPGVLEDSSGNMIDVLDNDSPGPGEDAVDSISIISIGSLSDGGAATVVNGKISYAPAADFFGTETFTYTIEDLSGLTDTATVTVLVENVNDPPVAVDDTVFVDELTDGSDPTNTLDLLGNDKFKDDPDNEGGVDTLEITAVTQPINGGTVEIINGGQNVKYIPETDKLGPFEDSFTYTITDSGGLTDTATVTVNVEPVIRPRARDDAYTVAEDSKSFQATNVFDVLTNDLFNDGAAVTVFEVVTPAAQIPGTLTIVFDSIRYEPTPDYFGTFTFEYRIDDDFVGNDGPSQPDTATVTVTVTPVNDAPTANDDTFDNILEDSTDVPLDVLDNDSILPDVDEVLTITRVGTSDGVTDGETDEGGSVVVVNGMVEYTPLPDFFGTDSFTYTISDPGGLTDTASVTITVDNTNDDPTAVNDTYTGIAEDSTGADNKLDVLDNDEIAPDVGETLTITRVGTSDGVMAGKTDQGGTVEVLNGLVEYAPPGDFFGTDTFTYTISDGNGGSDTAAVTLTIDDVNDDPTATPDIDDDRLLALKNFADQKLDVLANDSVEPDMPEDETLRIVGLGADMTPTSDRTFTTPHGEVRIDDNGTPADPTDDFVVYTPDTDFESGEYDTFYYTIEDGRGGSAVAKVEVEVIDAVPSDISGVVYLDVNNNGIKDPQEIALAGVEVTLVGTNIRDQSVDITVSTDVNGVFMFAGILPTSIGDLAGYSLLSNTAEFTIDGKDRIIDATEDENYDPGDTGNDVFTGINLGVWGTDRADGNYLFGERGLTGKYISIAQYLSSTRKGLAAALSTAGEGEDYWFTVMQGWDGIKSASVRLSGDMTTATLTVEDMNGGFQTRTISYKDYHVAGDRTTGKYMIYFNGSADDFGFDLGGDLSAVEGTPGEVDVPMEARELEMLAAGGGAEYARGVDEIFGHGDWA